MSRTKKDRPYKVKLNDLRAAGKTRPVARVIGYNGNPVVSDFPDRELSAVFLKGDVEGIKAHRARLAGVDARIVETEYKLTVGELYCTAKEPHRHDGELYQLPGYPWDNRGRIPHDLFPVFSRTKNTHPNCCYPFVRRTRTVVQILVHRVWTPSANVYVDEDYDSNLISWSTPPKTRHREMSRRAKTRNSLGALRRSPDVEEAWDGGTALDGPDRDHGQW